MIYHVTKKLFILKCFSRNNVQLIMFLNRLFKLVETNYWLIELKFADLVRILQKICYLMKSTETSVIIHTNLDIALKISTQITLITFFIDKFNFWFVRAFDYIHKISFIIRNKSKKLHLILDTIFQLFLLNSINSFVANVDYEKKLDVLFIVSIIELHSKMKKKLLSKYRIDLTWIKIIKFIDISDIDNTNISFVREN